MTHNLNDMCGIYMITNKINGKKYIGKSIHIGIRWKEHCKPHVTETHIDRAITKYGPENFEINVIEGINSDEENLEELLNQREIYYINLYNAKESENFYNHSYGGDGFFGGNKHPNHGKCNYKHHQCKFYIIDDKGGMDFLKKEKSNGISLINLANSLNCSEDLILHYLRVHGFKNWDSLSEVRESALGYNNHQCKWQVIDDAGGLNYLKDCVLNGKNVNEIAKELKKVSRHSIKRYLMFNDYENFTDFKKQVLFEAENSSVGGIS